MSTVAKNNERPPKPPRPLKLRVAAALRWVHIYLSMFSFLVVLFFSVTGLTLNHPDWLSKAPRLTERTGQLPPEWLKGADIDKLQIVERLRSEFGVRGALDDFRTDDTECSFSFKSAGYSADGTLTRATGALQLTVTEESTVAVFNDLHKGRHTGGLWSWVIDLSAIFLITLSLTGIGLFLYLKRLRVAGLITAIVGAVLLIVLLKLTLR